MNNPSHPRPEAAARLAALRALLALFGKKERLDLALEAASRQLSPADRRLAQELACGVARRYYSLDADIHRFVAKTPPQNNQMALLLGAYQLRHTRIAAHAAIFETIEAAKQAGMAKASGFLNAVLRKVAGSLPPTNLKPHEELELPPWLHEKWLRDFGAEKLAAFSGHLLTPPPLTLAILNGRNEWLAAHPEGGRGGDISPFAVLLEQGGDVRAIPGYEAGDWLIMDQSAQLAALAVGSVAGAIADMCAAPGGKTVLLSRLQNQPGSVVAIESAATRLPRLRENRARCHATGPIVQADAGQSPFASGAFAAVLLDAPCTASGVLRKNPDGKFLHSFDEIKRQVARQKRLLIEALRLLRPGGRLVYAVCSLHPEEGTKQINSLLAGGEVVALGLPEALTPFATAPGQALLLPGPEHDGFFVAVLQKK